MGLNDLSNKKLVKALTRHWEIKLNVTKLYEKYFQ